MKIFTLWNQNIIPTEYQNCLDAWGDRIVVIRGDSGTTDPRLWADHERFRLLADPTFYPDDDVLYVDADTIPATGFDEVITTLDRTNPGIATERGCMYDIWALIRWKGQYDLFQRLCLKHKEDIELFGYFRDLNSVERNNIGRINGYPDNKIIKHLNLSQK